MLINNIKKNMKKVYKKLIILFIMIFLGIILNCSESNAASATISASSQNVIVGENVTITVTANGCLSELTVSGPGISGSVDIISTDLTNQSKTETYKLDTSSAGKKTVTLSGSVVDADRTELPINKSVTVTVEEKKEEQKPVEQPKEETPEPQQPTTTPEPEPQKPTEPTFKNVNETVYVNQESVNVRGTWSASGGQYGTLKKGDSVTRTGISSETINGYVWSRITYNGKTAYVISSALTTTKVEVKEEEKEEEEKSTNKLLKELIVKDYELTPEFNPQTTKYSLTLNETDEMLDITATPEDEKAIVNITGNESFKVGNNIVKITVTAEDGTARIYTITVSKNNEDGVVDSLKLDTLQISNGTLEPEFDPDITNYVITVEDPSTFTVESILATVSDKNVTITTSETTPDENGEKIITLMLESQKEEKTGIYQITVKKPVVNQMAPTTLTNSSDNTIYYILGGIIGALLILIIIIIIALKKTSNKEEDEDIKNADELSDDYDYNLKGAIDEANRHFDDMVEESNFKSQILNTDLRVSEDTKVIDNFDNDEEDFKPSAAPRKKGKHF